MLIFSVGRLQIRKRLCSVPKLNLLANRGLPLEPFKYWLTGVGAPGGGMYIITDASAECSDGVRLEGNRSFLRASSLPLNRFNPDEYSS